MTVIECYDRRPLVNLMATLAAHPDKLVFVGRDARDAACISAYRAVLKAKGVSTAVEWRTLPADLHGVVDALTALVKKEEPCAIDVAGGDETLLVAVGMVYEVLRGKAKVTLWRADIARRCVHRLSEGDTLAVPAHLMTARDLITLHGGCIRSTAGYPDAADADDIDALWEIAKADNTAWNTRLMYINEMEKRMACDDNCLAFTLSPRTLSGQITRFADKLREVRALLTSLHRRGLLTHYRDGDTLQYTYKTRAVHEALSGAGNILEMKVLSEVHRARRNGERIFHDCARGVTIDWDGAGLSRTNNEIDVIAMCGLTPVFISCKNGQVAEAEMYKLSAVADRFGGTTVRKMLIVTDLPASKRAAARERAASLGIQLVDNAEELRKEDWSRCLHAVST